MCDSALLYGLYSYISYSIYVYATARKLNAVNYTSDEEELPSTKRGHDTDEHSDASSDRRSEDQDSARVKSVSDEEDHGTEMPLIH